MFLLGHFVQQQSLRLNCDNKMSISKRSWLWWPQAFHPKRAHVEFPLGKMQFSVVQMVMIVWYDQGVAVWRRAKLRSSGKAFNIVHIYVLIIFHRVLIYIYTLKYIYNNIYVYIHMVIKYIHTYVNTLNSPGSTNLWLRTASREQLRDPSGKCLQPWRPGRHLHRHWNWQGAYGNR